LIDRSTVVEGGEGESSANVESTKSFQVFFPDVTMSSLTSGQQNLEEFQRLIRAAKEGGYNVNFQCDLMKEAVADYRDNNLVNACLLQFPYRHGGMHEPRIKSNGSFTNSIDTGEYVEHLSQISQPHFHQPLFSLILYNVVMKQMMVESAGWKVWSKTNVATLATNLTAEDLDRAISKQRRGINFLCNGNGHTFLRALDATTRIVPHTNEAAKYAKQDGEAIQHQFGMASFFLMATPYDKNSILIQIYNGKIIDDDRPIASLSNEGGC